MKTSVKRKRCIARESTVEMRSNDEREEFTRVKLKRQNSLSEIKMQWNTVMVKGKLKQRGYKRDVLQSYKMRTKVIENRMERYNLIVLNNMTINFLTN